MNGGATRLLLGLAILSGLKFWLASGQFITARAYTRHDDRLYLTLAQHVAGGRWLGPYDNLTLAKGPFYPLWIAGTFIAGVPLSLSQTLLYITACVVTVLAVRPIVQPIPLLLLIFAVLLFNPAVTSVHFVLREGVYYALTLLVFACFIGLFLRRYASVSVFWRWAVVGGLALGAFWLTREEGVWILPSVLFILAATALLVWRRYGVRGWRHLVAVASPVALLGMTLASVSSVNLHRYGVPSVTEFDSPEWLAAYGALSRVEHDNWRQYVLVPRDVRQRIYEVSPAFADLKPFLEGELGQIWSSFPCQLLPTTCGDIGGGWFMWAFRDAVAAAGHYRSGPAALDYYRRVADEVNTACANGALPCGPPRATMLPPWRAEYLPAVQDSLLRAARYFVQFEGVTSIAGPSDGDELALLPFRTVTRDRIMPTTNDRARFGRYGIDSAKLRVLDAVGWNYARLGPALTGAMALTLVAVVISTMLGFRSVMLIPIIALLGAAAARVALLALIDSMTFHAINIHYLGSAHALLLLAGLLSLFEGFAVIIWWRSRRSRPATAMAADAVRSLAAGGE
jgi:hypothetical protein